MEFVFAETMDDVLKVALKKIEKKKPKKTNNSNRSEHKKKKR
jgi:hypothetical protein